MHEPRPAYREMTDKDNRNVLGTFTPKMISCAQRSIARARELEIPEKEERVLDFLMMTTGLEGRGREALRDALMGAKPPQPALAANQAMPVQQDAYRGVPRLA